MGSVSDHAGRLVVSRSHCYDPASKVVEARCVARNASRQPSGNGLSARPRAIAVSAASIARSSLTSAARVC
jgi:hypothetical protein